MSKSEGGTGLVNTKIMRQKIRITHFWERTQNWRSKNNTPHSKKSIKIGAGEPVGGVDFLNIRVNF